jgi:predicted enzyme related to lactoylglutathione lyase
MKRVTGLGGVFFTSNNPKRIAEWYRRHLGIRIADGKAGILEWKEKGKRGEAYTIWAPFPRNTRYFRPGKKQFMLNYRVENLKGLLKQLKKEGVRVIGSVEEYDYGNFGWIMDPDGNKVELWEPNDRVFHKINKLGKKK